MRFRLAMAWLLFLAGVLGGALLYRVALSSSPTSSGPESVKGPVVEKPWSRENPISPFWQHTNDSVPFHWSQLESKDYKVYIANLRAIGCPEKTIQDIIRAEVNQLFESRHRQLEESRQGKAWNYWEANRNFSPWKEYQNRLKHRALEKEKEMMLADLLGHPAGDRPIPPGTDLASSEQADPARWSPELRERVHQIQEKFHLQQEEIFHNSHGRIYPEDAVALQEIHDQRMAELQEVLTPEQLRQFELRESPTAEHLRHDLIAFKPTAEEFEAIFDVRLQFEDQLGYRDFDFEDPAYRENREQIEARMNEEIRSILGEERFQDYALANDPRYRDLYNLRERFDVPEESIHYMFELWQTSERQVDQVRSDPSMDEAQRRQALVSMRMELEREAQTALGDQVFYNYRNRGGVWMHHLFGE